MKLEQGVGNVVEQGVGNVVEQGVGNVVEQDVGNVVEQGVGPVVEQGVGTVVEQFCITYIIKQLQQILSHIDFLKSCCIEMLICASLIEKR